MRNSLWGAGVGIERLGEEAARWKPGEKQQEEDAGERQVDGTVTK